MRLLYLIILSFALITGCDDDSVSSSAKFEAESGETQFIHLSTQTNLAVVNTNGTIRVSVSDTSSGLYCEITKKVKSKISGSNAQAHLADISVKFTTNSTITSIDVNNPINDERDYEILLDISLPYNFDYDLSLGNGTVSVSSTTKNLVIGLGNGIVATDLVLVDTCFSSISIGNGDLSFTIPNNTNTMLVASVGNGLISNNGLNFQNQQITSRYFSGTLGNGIGNIALSVGNGNITMNRR